MNTGLTQVEEEYVRALIGWDKSQRLWDWALCNVALIIAGVVFVGAALLAYRSLNDRMIYGVLVPGFVVGLLLVGLYVLAGQRIRERHKLATIVRKLKRADGI